MIDIVIRVPGESDSNLWADTVPARADTIWQADGSRLHVLGRQWSPDMLTVVLHCERLKPKEGAPR